MLTASEIAGGKARTAYSLDEEHHEHDDCIRIAYEWLDAQRKTKSAIKSGRPLKHLIEKWGGRYVSTTDVEVAATLHPEIQGKYPYYNISTRLTRPSDRRLDGIDQAFTQGYRDRINEAAYKVIEE